VPASSANLGPGFDAMGLALGIYLECRFRESSELSIHVEGRDAGAISTSEDNLIWQTALAVARDMRMSMPPIALQIRNDIPVGKGLGSSAAALTAGVIIADRLLGLHWKPLRILDEAARLEGHPDNVAACILGSVVASAIDSGGVARTVRLSMPPQFGVGVVVPDFVLPTAHARSVLPDCYPRADAIFNVQRAALLMAAIATGSVSAFPAAGTRIGRYTEGSRSRPAGLRVERRRPVHSGLLRARVRAGLRSGAPGLCASRPRL
jgi:homoserine kinase